MIDAKHQQYTKYVNKWQLINDIVDQENLENYLIELNPSDTSQKNADRNAAYKERAVFYALTNQTVIGMLGIIFTKQPEFETDDVMSYLSTNADGRGNSIYQQSQVVTKNVLSVSRDGLYVSYPITEGEVSKADINDGLAVATIQRIEAERVINWAEITTGSITKLSLVVFKDNQTVIVDYEHKETETIRELYLEGVYKERIWIKDNKKEKWIVLSESIPTDKNGNALTEIPFKFVGSVNNDVEIDNPNMLAMSKLNVAHYRNSADFEDSTWYVGQAQPWMSNVNQTHVDLMTKNNMYVGSRELLAVPDGGSFGFESADPNPLVRQAMQDKVEMMVGLGAQMVIPGGVAKTAQQTYSERQSQHSTMTLVVKNVSDAYTQCLKWVELFMIGSVSDKAIYNINNDFIKPDTSPAELKEMILGFMTGAVPVGDYVRYMKDSGKFDEEKPEKDYSEELEASKMPDLGAE